MNILCVIDSLGSGGAQRQMVELAKGFKERGHVVSFLVYHNINFFKDSLDAANIPVFAIVEPRYIKRLIKMRKYIRQSGCDAVLSFLDAANFICEVAGFPWRKWKLVVGERSANPAIFSSTKLKAYKWLHFLANYIVANSNENLKMVRKVNPLLNRKKCKVIYNIVDTGKWIPSSDYMPLNAEKFNLVVAASHQYLKNARGLIEAVYQLDRESQLRLKVDWYGDESWDNSFKEAKDLVQKYALNDIFSFYNATYNIIQKMQSADAVGLFSFYEGLPNAICEAMVLGKVIISSRVSDVPDLLENNNTFLFNPKDPTDINRVLLYILSLNKSEILEIGKENGIKGLLTFDASKIILSYETLLR